MFEFCWVPHSEHFSRFLCPAQRSQISFGAVEKLASVQLQFTPNYTLKIMKQKIKDYMSPTLQHQ